MRWCYRNGYILLASLSMYTAGAAAMDLSQCFADVISCANNASSPNCSSGLSISSATASSLLRTNQGYPASTPDEATALSYTGCTSYCGNGLEPFSWSVFAQEYSVRLLPYLVLLSQLPFGAPRRLDDLMSAVLTLGSPTLAGYSLFMTLLNTRWVNDQLFSGIDYPTAEVRQSVVRVLSSLQQVHLRVYPEDSAQSNSLIVRPGNDDWWAMFSEELNYSHTWSIASATSIGWVITAYLLTVTDSISDVPNNIQYSGQGSSSGWLWLLPIVVGWFILSPKCDYRHVHDAYRRANKLAVVADSHDPAAAPANVTSGFGPTIGPSSEGKFGVGDITSPDELRVPPVFNYARIFSWRRSVYLTSRFYRTAWRKLSHRADVDGEHIRRNVHTGIPRESRLWTGGLPEANFTWSHGLLHDMVVASLMSLMLQWGTTGAAVIVAWFTPTIGLGCRSLAYLLYGALSTIVWFLLVLSSVLGYYAQYPADGLESFNSERHRRSECFGAPSVLPTSLLALEVLGASFRLPNGEKKGAIPVREFGGIDGEDVDVLPDTKPVLILTRSAHLRRTHARTVARVADWLRWTGKALAILNAISLIANSIFQYAGVYSNCYCDASVMYWGAASAFTIVHPVASDIDVARRAWIVGLGLALSCCSIFTGVVYLVRDAKPWQE